VVLVGDAVTLAPIVADRPVAGDHVYVLAPDAVRPAEEPVQMATLDPALTGGRLLTDTITVAKLLQPLAFVPFTV
jgi:hypothetical protein